MEVDYIFRGEISQLGLDVVYGIIPKMLEIFPPKRTDNPTGIVQCVEYRFNSDDFQPSVLNVELNYEGDKPDEDGKNYLEVPCLFEIDLNKRKVIPPQESLTTGFEKIKTHLEELLSELSS